MANLNIKQNSIEVSIIIINWNSADYLAKCIDSIYQETRSINFEILVVDNASYDGCLEKLKAKYPNVVYIQNKANLGFARANNLAASKAKGRTLLFLNPDTKIIDGAIDHLYSLYFESPRCGILGCTLLNGDGSFQESCVQTFPTVMNQMLDSKLMRRVFPKSTMWGWRYSCAVHGEVVEVDAVSGACMMIAKSLFEEVGGFCDSYFMYGEDVDLCYRVNKRGFSNFHARNVSMIHYGGGSTSGVGKPSLSALMRESLYTYFRLHHGRLRALAYRASMFIAGMFRIIFLFAFAPLMLIFLDWSWVRYGLIKWWSICAWSLGLLNPLKIIK